MIEPESISAPCDICGERGEIRILDTRCRLRVGACCMREHQAAARVLRAATRSLALRDPMPGEILEN